MLVRELDAPRGVASRAAAPWPGIAAACAVAAWLAGAVLLPYGFQAFDDAKYLNAAERWLAEGAHPAADHWAARLPYVLALAGGLRLFGPGEAGFLALHALLFALVMLAAWQLGRAAFGPRIAALGVALLAWTPMGLRLPSQYMPEAMEMAFAGLCCALVLGSWQAPPRRRLGILFAAGILGGLALGVRQTSVAVPAALALLLLADGGRDLRHRTTQIVALAAGHALPVLAEIAFNLAVAGDPLHRLAVDLRHTEIPSEHLDGEIYQAGGRLLFNWDLAARWRERGPLDLHWSVNPAIGLLASPWLLLLPVLGLAGAVLALRRPGDAAARRLARLALLLLGLQYALNTFVLVIAPNVRYLAVAMLHAAPLAALLLARLLPAPRAQWAAWAVLFAVPALAAAALQPSVAANAPTLERLAAERAPLYLSGQLHEAMRLRFAEDPALAERLPREPAPAGALLAAVRYAPPEGGFDATCPDGTPRWRREAHLPPGSLPWRAMEALRAAPLVPETAARLLRRDAAGLEFLRRAC